MLPFFDAPTWALLVLASDWVIRLVMLVVVPMRRSPAAAKGWLLLILFLPWFGLAVYLVIGRAKLPTWRREQLKKLPQALAPVIARLRAHPRVFHPELDPELRPAVHLAENLGHLPILGGNQAEVLAKYDEMIHGLVADINAARHHVHLLYYIYADDETTRPVTEALCRAAARGVKCRVLVDAVGSRAWVSSLFAKLQAGGVEAHKVLPVGLLRRLRLRGAKAPGRFDLRNHRKIAVIDGHIAYTGSQNLVAAQFKHGITYEELVVRATGPGVLALQYVFVADWFLETDEVLDTLDVFPNPESVGSLPVQVLPSGPDFATETTQRMLVALVHGARRRVVLTTPYFIPDEPLMQALETAVRRGVEVHLVASAKKDQFLVGLAQESYYEELLEEGVKVHLYRDKFLHAKHLSIDDDVALVGSSNMDIRSFALNAEVSMLLYDPAFVAKLRAEQDRYFARCDLLTLERWRQRSGFQRFWQNMARLFSPLL